MAKIEVSNTENNYAFQVRKDSRMEVIQGYCADFPFVQTRPELIGRNDDHPFYRDFSQVAISPEEYESDHEVK